VVTGWLGLVWVVLWWWLYRSAKTHGWLTERERQWILGDENDASRSAAVEKGWTWLQALGRVEVWCLLMGRMLSDPVWFFYQNWYPKYLVSARGFTQADVKLTWVMFLAAGLGSLVGGWIAGRFIKHGRSPERVRLFTMLGCAVFMPLSPLVALVPSATLSLAVASILIFFHLAWLVNIGALVVDLVPQRSLATVFGIVASGSSLGAILMNDLVAKLVKHYSYTSWFVIAAFLHLAVIPLLLWGVRRRKAE